MTEPSAVVERLYFGREDAERDMADGLLRAGFLRTAAYDAAVSGRKMLIIGRKGSGKSAICMHLTADGVHPGGTVLITPDDAAGDEIRRFELQGLTGDTAKSLIWRYVFAVQAARHIVGHAKAAHGRRRRMPASVRALRRFLRAGGESPADRLYDRLVNGARGLQTSLSLEAFGVKAAMDVGKASEGARAARQLEVVEQGVAEAFEDLGCAGSHAPLLLLVDQLEQVWSTDPDSNAMVIGLLLAAKHAAGSYGKALRCLLFLRSDIYDSLNFGEGDKFHSDELRIHWTGAGLKDLALTRARASAGTELTNDGLWQEVFPPAVRGEDTADYLFSRALPRPRDAIQYLNLCRDTAVENEHPTVQESDILRATQQFSEWKLQDLAKEYLVTHPFLSRLFVMFQNTGYVVMRSALESRFDAIAETLHRQFPAYADGLTLSGVIDTLFAVSFLGVRRGSDVVYAGGAQIPVQPHETEFHIHPCFRPALGAAQAIDLHPFQPQAYTHWLTSSQRGGYLQSTSGAGFTVGRDFALLEELGRACGSILRQVGRAVGMPADTSGQVSQQVGRVMSDASEALLRLREDKAVDASGHVLAAAHYFSTLAAQLRASGIDDGNGAGSVVRRIEDEARRLIREVGGSTGGSGYSNT
jgi:hypothetical protein